MAMAWFWAGMAWADLWTLLAYGYRPGVAASLCFEAAVAIGIFVLAPRESRSV